MSEFPIEWAASIIAVITSSFRAFNLGYQSESYLVSIFTYIVFMNYAEKKTQKILNLFYIFTSLAGVYRYGIPYENLIKIFPFFIIFFAIFLSIFIIKISKKLVKNNTKKNQ